MIVRGPLCVTIAHLALHARPDSRLDTRASVSHKKPPRFLPCRPRAPCACRPRALHPASEPDASKLANDGSWVPAKCQIHSAWSSRTVSQFEGHCTAARVQCTLYNNIDALMSTVQCVIVLGCTWNKPECLAHRSWLLKNFNLTFSTPI